MDRNLENEIIILEGAEKVVLLMAIAVVQDIKQMHQIQQKIIQNVFKMDYKAVIIQGKLNIQGALIRTGRKHFFAKGDGPE